MLSIQGGASPWRPDDLEQRHGVLPRVVVGTLPGVGHNIHHEVPGPLASIIKAWLASPDTCPAGLEPYKYAPSKGPKHA